MSLIHAVTGEHSRIRRWTLGVFARYVELPLLGLSYHLLRGRLAPLGRISWVRAALGWAVAAPFGSLGDTGRAMPGPDVLEMIEQLEGPIAVGTCRCRGAHHGCGHPLQTDIVIHTGVEAWTHAFPHDYRRIDKEEAKRIVAECRRLGLWQMVFVHCPHTAARERSDHDENEYVICNCCRCGCVPYVLNRDLGQRIYPLLVGRWRAVTDPAYCSGHGACVPACPFDARELIDGQSRLTGLCLGCGLCATVCPETAITMRPRAEMGPREWPNA